MKTFNEFLNENTNNPYFDMLDWLESIHQWDYIESEGKDITRFDWDNGNQSFWLNKDISGEGTLPSKLKEMVIKKGIEMIDNE